MTSSSTAKNSDDALLEKYLQEIAKYAPLSDAEEARLSMLISQGDKEAKDKLVKANLKFVVSIARQYAREGVNMLDIVNEGNIALIKAAGKFDATRGQRFSAYAVWDIRRTIEASLPTDEARPNSLKTENTANMSMPADGNALLDSDNESLAELFARLPEREKLVLKAYFGINSEQMTMMEIGMRYGMKRERVRQVRDRALRRIRKIRKHET